MSYEKGSLFAAFEQDLQNHEVTAAVGADPTSPEIRAFLRSLMATIAATPGGALCARDSDSLTSAEAALALRFGMYFSGMLHWAEYLGDPDKWRAIYESAEIAAAAELSGGSQVVH